MEDLMQYTQNEVESYFRELNRCDDIAKKEALKKYLKKVEQLLDMEGIRGIDIYELEDKINDGIKNEYSDELKFYDRKTTREDEYDDMTRSVQRKEKTLENTKSVIKNAQEVVEDESRESSNSMNQYLQEMLRVANKITGKEVVSQGYYNINNFLDGLSRVPVQLADEVKYEYDQMIKETTDKVIENFEDTLRSFSKSNDEKSVSDLNDEFKTEELYEKYLSEGSKMELNLGPQELDIKLCVIDLPTEKTDGSLKKGVAVSKSILEQAIEENNSNLTHDNESYVRVETKSFYFLVKAEEHEKAMHSVVLNKKPKIEKEPVKPKKDSYEYTPFMS